MDSAPTGQPSTSPSPPRLEDLARRTARRLLLPYIIGYASSSSAAPSDQPREVAVIVNPRTGSLTMIDGGIDGLPFLHGKDGLVPASKESIESMPTVKVAEQGFDCAICLSEFEIGEEAKQMPCSHKFHAPCIDKWLGIQGSCPVCRHRMPVEGEGEMKKDGGGDNGDREADEPAEEDEEEGNGGEEDGEEEEEAAEEGEIDLGFLSRIPTFVFHIYFAGRNRPSTNSSADPQSESEEESGEANESEGNDSEEESDDPSDMEVDGESTSPEMEMDIDDNISS